MSPHRSPPFYLFNKNPKGVVSVQLGGTHTHTTHMLHPPHPVSPTFATRTFALATGTSSQVLPTRLYIYLSRIHHPHRPRRHIRGSWQPRQDDVELHLHHRHVILQLVEFRSVDENLSGLWLFRAPSGHKPPDPGAHTAAAVHARRLLGRDAEGGRLLPDGLVSLRG